MTDWHSRRKDLQEGQAFIDYLGDKVMLDRRVPGDGTQWYVAIWCGDHWSHDDCIIEPGDLRERVVP